jgi:hypothetical protein
MIVSMILSIAILLPTPITSGFQILVPPNIFGQSIIDDANEGNSSVASDTRNNNNSDNNLTDDNLVAISTIIATSNSSAAPSNNTTSNTTETTPPITVNDVINSTYIVSKGDDQDRAERRIVRAIVDRIDDLLHTVIRSNGTIIFTATITNDFIREITIINNNTRFFEEVLPDQLEIAFDRISANGSISQPANSSMLEIHTDVEMMCVANSTTLENCDLSMRIR